jgi:putative phosphoribosyl transferase
MNTTNGISTKVRILSRESKLFNDRKEAGKLLAAELSQYKGQNAVVLGIPRGGIVVAREIAREIDGELDIILAHKLRSPGYSELAMGAISEDGKIFLNEEVVRELGVSETNLHKERQRQMVEINRRIEMFRKERQKAQLSGRIVIVTDDGIATGSTTQAALWSVRQERPRKLICAMPVGPEETLMRLADDADEIICLRSPSYFMAVGQFYVRFQPVEDEEVREILHQEQQRLQIKK